MNMSRRILTLGAALLLTSGCAGVKEVLLPAPEDREAAEAREAEAERREALDAVPLHPADAAPATGTTTAEKLWRSALDAKGRRVVVSTSGRALWVMRDDVVEFRAPVAVGMHDKFTYDGKTYDFKTPLGKRSVRGRATDPLWVPPDWHYFEKAVAQDLEIVRLRKGSKAKLSDGTTIEVRGEEVGRVNQYGNFWPFTPGSEIVFDGKIFIPPIGSRQRKVPEVLGTHKLDLGDGYLIHGTNEEDSVGEAVSHGCVRMYNDDVAQVYASVPNGTAVYIY